MSHRDKISNNTKSDCSNEQSEKNPNDKILDNVEVANKQSSIIPDVTEELSLGNVDVTNPQSQSTSGDIDKQTQSNPDVIDDSSRKNLDVAEEQSHSNLIVPNEPSPSILDVSDKQSRNVIDGHSPVTSDVVKQSPSVLDIADKPSAVNIGSEQSSSNIDVPGEQVLRNPSPSEDSECVIIPTPVTRHDSPITITLSSTFRSEFACDIISPRSPHFNLAQFGASNQPPAGDNLSYAQDWVNRHNLNPDNPPQSPIASSTKTSSSYGSCSNRSMLSNQPSEASPSSNTSTRESPVIYGREESAYGQISPVPGVILPSCAETFGFHPFRTDVSGRSEISDQPLPLHGSSPAVLEDNSRPNIERNVASDLPEEEQTEGSNEESLSDENCTPLKKPRIEK